MKRQIITFLFIFKAVLSFSQTKDTISFSFCHSVPATIQDCQPFKVVENSPEFPGGQAAFMKYLTSNLNLSVTDHQDKTIGTIYISFTIDKEGWVKDVCINGPKARGLYAIEKEALRVVYSMPQWKPAIQNGEKVCFRFMLPIRFNNKAK